MNRLLKRVVSGIVTAAIALSAAVVSPDIFAGLNVSASAASTSDWNTYTYKKQATFSKDTQTVYGGETYSLKIENNDYDCANYNKTVTVKPNTKYVFSAYVKYSGYKLDPASPKDTGALLRITGVSTGTAYWVRPDNWTKIDATYTTAQNETSVELQLCNGWWNELCKGTAYFSAISFVQYDETKWNKDYSSTNTTVFSTDTKTVYGNSPYSLKIENNDFSTSMLKRTVTVKPETTYRLSAYVKYSGYNHKPDFKYESGATLRISGSSTLNSSFSRSEGWKKLSLIYHTEKNETSVELQLSNGGWGGSCKGTAWFSNIRLEEVTETTNQWNILTIFFTKANTSCTLPNGEKVKIKSSYPDDLIDYYKDRLDMLYYELDAVSGGLMDVRNIDYKVSDLTLTDYSIPISEKNAVCHNWDNPEVVKEITRLIGDNIYQQIIIIEPNTEYVSFWGMCHNSYSLGKMVEVKVGNEETIEKNSHKIHVFLHEIGHGLEGDTKAFGIDITALHEEYNRRDEYPDNYDWYSAYYQNKIKGGTGVDPRAYYRPSVYTLVTDDMTPGEGVTVSGTLPTHISKSATVSKIADKYYAGKAVKPAVTVKGLTKGTDYTVSYADNNAPGTAKVIIKGKGKYTGSIEVTFKIKLKRTTAKISSKTLKWGEVPGADGYKIYYSKDGGKYKKLTDTTALKYDLSKLKAGSYKFKIRAYSSTNTGKRYADWSKVVNITKK